jgi:hypothetical protein
MKVASKLSPAEASRLRGCTIKTIYVELWSGQLKAERVDGKWQITPEELRRRMQELSERRAPKH